MKLIPLTQGYFAQVDDTDYDFLMQWKWCVMKTKNTFYASKCILIEGRKGRISMHRFLLGLTHLDKKLKGDHKDHNGLNNQRSNIRIATSSQNNINTTGRGGSKYLGVSLKNKRVKYINKFGILKVYEPKYFEASIWDGKKRHYLGNFKDEELAAKTYDIAAKKIHGEWANLNFK